MRLSEQQFERLGQAANPFNPPPTTDLCNMRGHALSGLWGAVLAVKAHALGTVNLVDRSLKGTDALRISLTSAVAKDALGLDPEKVEGFTKPDGTSSNRVLLDFARQTTGRDGVVCSKLAHKSIHQAVSRGLRVVELNEDFQMNEAALLDAIDETTGVLVLTTGTTELGTVDKLSPAVAEKCRQLGIWIHLDAAYGGMNLGCLSESHPQRNQLRALATSDLVKSITVCPHKFAGSLGCSIAFLKGQDVHPAESYIPGASALAGTSAPSEIAFKTDRTIKKLGKRGMQDLAERTLGSAQYFARALKHFAGIETIVPVQSGIVAMATPSAESAKDLCEGIRLAGFSVAEPLAIETNNGIQHGVRIVFTANTYFDPLSLEDLAKIIAFNCQNHSPANSPSMV